MKDEYFVAPRVAESYDRDHPGLEGDIDFYTGLALEAHAAGQPVLELACGTGRVSIPIARAGVRVVGLDRSPAMLDIARRKSAGIENIRWMEGDMADFDLPERFGLVFIPFRSFLHLTTVAEQKSCLASAHRHLAAGGRLALNFFNPDIVMMSEWLSTKRGALVRLGECRSAGTGNAVQRWSTRDYRRANQTIEERWLDQELTDERAVISRIYRDLKQRYVFRYEMEHLLALGGFEVEALYGWFDRRPFTDESGEMVWLARRPKQ